MKTSTDSAEDESPKTSNVALGHESFKSILERLNSNKNQNQVYARSQVADPVLTKIERRRKELENDAFSQDIALKRITLIVLFVFLALETVLVFTFAFLQATKLLSFSLEEWSFKLLITATLSQITLMLNVAVKHLFPNSKS